MKSVGRIPLFLSCAMVSLAMGCSRNHEFDLPATSNKFGMQIEYNNKVDFVFVVDNSSSMRKHQESLSQSLPRMLDTLLNLKMDFHFAVITTSMGGEVANGGRFLGSPSFLTSRTPELSELLAQRLVVGQNGSNLERGVQSLHRALSPDHLAGNGLGFLRRDAFLVVLVLTDEDDKSNITPQQMADFLTALKPPFEDGTPAWIVNTIGVPTLTTQCMALGAHVEPSLIYNELTQLSGGVLESICAPDFVRAVSNISARIVHLLTDYPLDKIPLVETIRVSVNGIEVFEDAENGWQYLADKNMIRFNGAAIPPADAEIRIDFKPAFAN